MRVSVYLRNKRFALFSSHRFPNCDSYRFRLFHREATYVHVELHVRESSMLRATESKLFYFSFDHSEPLGPVQLVNHRFAVFLITARRETVMSCVLQSVSVVLYPRHTVLIERLLSGRRGVKEKSVFLFE